MIHIFHGEKLEDSLKEIELLKEKLKINEVIDLDGKKTTATDLIQATESASLFQNQRLIIVRNYLIKFKRGDLKELKIQIERIPPYSEIVFIENIEISKNILSIFPKNSDIALFKPDKLIFKLVDNIGIKEPKQIYYLFQETLKLETIEFVFTMLVRQFRLLLMIKNEIIPKGLFSWQINKLRIQASHFTLKEMLNIYKKLLHIDYNFKSGISEQPLENRLQQLILLKE